MQTLAKTKDPDEIAECQQWLDELDEEDAAERGIRREPDHGNPSSYHERKRPVKGRKMSRIRPSLSIRSHVSGGPVFPAVCHLPAVRCH